MPTTCGRSVATSWPWNASRGQAAKERSSAQEHLVDIAKRRLDAAKEIYKTLGQAAAGKVKYDLDLGYFQAEAENRRPKLISKSCKSARS